MCFPLGAHEGDPMPKWKQQQLSEKLVEAMKDEESLQLPTAAWYEKFEILESEVILMQRSKAKYSRHFPGRLPKDIRTNSFEPNIHSKYVRSSMDIQAILSTAATYRYIMKYVMKGEPTRADEAKADGRAPSTYRGSPDNWTFVDAMDARIAEELSSRKVTMFEATWTNLQLPIVEFTLRPIVVSLHGLVNDSLPVEQDLEDVPDESTAVHTVSK